MTTDATIRCQIDRTHAEFAGPLLRSLVHHQCALADCDVDTVSALDEAAAEVYEELSRCHATVAEIASSPDLGRLEIRLTLEHGPDETDRGTPARTFVAGPISRTTLDIDIDDDGRLRLVHRFDPSEQ